jgi:hypothetical protein
MKFLTLFISACFILVSAKAKAQEFNVLAFDGSDQTVSMSYSEVKELLKISIHDDTLYVPGVSYMDTVFNLNKQFFQVSYGVRGGTGLHIKHILLLSIKNNKLFQSLHITSVFDEEFIDYSKKVDSSDPVSIKTVYESNLRL